MTLFFVKHSRPVGIVRNDLDFLTQDPLNSLLQIFHDSSVQQAASLLLPAKAFALNYRLKVTSSFQLIRTDCRLAAYNTQLTKTWRARAGVDQSLPLPAQT